MLGAAGLTAGRAKNPLGYGSPSVSRQCGQCGGTAALAFVTRDFNRKVSDASFEYYRCRSCGVVFLDPVPGDLHRYYPPGYHAIPGSEAELLGPGPDECHKLDAIGKDGRGRRLLEIGPSYGRFAARAKRAGFRVDAIELDMECCRFLTEVVGVPATHSTDPIAALEAKGEYDVVALWHSIEHMPEPWRLLDAVAGHVAPGGIVALSTPNPLSLQFRIFGRHWFHLDAPRHLALLPPAVIEARLAKHRLRRVLLTTQDQGSRECSSHGWVASSLLKFPRWTFELPYVHLGWWLRARLKRLEAREPLGPAYTIVLVRD